MKKWMTGLLVVFAILVVVALAGLTVGYYKFYKPLLSANTSVFARLDLQDLLVDPGDLERPIRVERPLRDETAADLNRPMVNDHLARLKDWLALAYFDL